MSRQSCHRDAINKILDEIAAEHSKQGIEKLVVSVPAISARYDKLAERSIRGIGFPSYWDYRYSSCTWKKHTGLIIEVEEFIQEREKEEFKKKHKNRAMYLQHLEEDTKTIPF